MQSGLEALKTAFSSKYYEVAAKCKTWERYAAKLRAQAEALEVENRLLREMHSGSEHKAAELQAQLGTVREELWGWKEVARAAQKRVRDKPVPMC